MLAIRVMRDQGYMGPHAFTLAWFVLVSAWGVATALYGARFYHAYREGIRLALGEGTAKMMAPLDDASATWVARVLGVGLAVAFLIRFLVALSQAQ